jgi:LPXTG-site transpeptidase (sortase) family protein
MVRALSTRLSIALGLLLAFYGINGTVSLLREGKPASENRIVGTLEGSIPAVSAGVWIPPNESSWMPLKDSNGIRDSNAIHTGSGSVGMPEGLNSETGASTDNLALEGLNAEAEITEVEAGGNAPLAPEIPEWISIPAIGLDAPVMPADTQMVKVGGKEYQQWLAPNKYASGWHSNSARLGEIGNTVLNGHHNVFGEVFGKLVELEVGDQIRVYSAESLFTYQITNIMILREKYEQIDVRMNNAQWILASQDERLTLITCWPYESNTHRLILVAKPLARSQLYSIGDPSIIEQ